MMHKQSTQPRGGNTLLKCTQQKLFRGGGTWCLADRSAAAAASCTTLMRRLAPVVLRPVEPLKHPAWVLTAKPVAAATASAALAAGNACWWVGVGSCITCKLARDATECLSGAGLLLL